MIRDILVKFRDDRGWTEYHTPERLAGALMVEAGELASLVQWGKEPDHTRLAEEIADVAIYLEYIAERFGLDVNKCIMAKIEKNAIKYPVDVNNERKHGWKV